VLVAYMDESGTHANAPITLVCALVNRLIFWSRMELPWRKDLGLLGLAWFHATDCENRKKDFEHIERPQRDRLVEDLSTLVCAQQPHVIAAAVIRSDWDREASSAIKNRFIDPYYFCFEHCLQKITKWSDAHAGGEPVALVIAKQEEYQDRAAELYRIYSQSTTFDGHRLGRFGMGSPRCLIPLQAADLVAYETYQYQVGRIRKSTNPVRPAFSRILAELPLFGGLHDKETLQNLTPIGKFFEGL
jgi:hypothetical protein